MLAGRYNIRNPDTIKQMARMVYGLRGKRQRFKDLVRVNGLDSGIRKWLSNCRVPVIPLDPIPHRTYRERYSGQDRLSQQRARACM